LDTPTFEHFLSIMGNEEVGLAYELIAIFLEDTPNKLGTMRQALADNDATTLYHTAHALKSSSAQFGALRFSSLCTILSDLGRAGTLTDAAATFARLEAAYDQLQANLHRILG
jgi:HPt (histidine-containing phosphotransfer) domain-containing protein